MAETKRENSISEGSDEKYEAMPFEQVMNQLESIVDKLERGDLPLEESISTFEAGIKLSRLGTRKLEEAEHRVELLLSEQKQEDREEAASS